MGVYLGLHSLENEKLIKENSASVTSSLAARGSSTQGT